LQVNEGPNGDPNYQDNKYHNTFNLKFDSDFIKDKDQLNIYGDISVNNNTENTSVGTHAIGDKFNLDFSVNLGNLSKWQNSRLWWDINGQSKGTAWKTHGTEAYIATDSELVFIINIPRGITVPNVSDLKFRVDGLNSLKFKKAERTGDKLIIRVHPSLSENGYLPARDYYAYLKTISNVKISVEGLLVNSEAAVNENITITGSVVGVQDELVTDSMEVAKKKIGAGSDDVRAAYFFAAKQSNSGRDAAAPQDKPNLISYTFKVNKATENTTPSNPGNTAKVAKKTKMPKTGDDTDVMLYVLLLGVSGTMLGGFAYLRRRKVS
uniref:LPXTG cell wall anchor domain-containing protein n=1 Tax=Mogibacterium timidum TaxID=35519 RepID=UPI0028D816AD